MNYSGIFVYNLWSLNYVSFNEEHSRVTPQFSKYILSSEKQSLLSIFIKILKVLASELLTNMSFLFFHLATWELSTEFLLW